MTDLKPAPSLGSMKSKGPGEGVSVRLREDLSVIGVLARKGQVEALAARYGLLDAPKISGSGFQALGIGPGRWLFLGRSLEELGSLGDLASLSDHSDGYAIFEIWGPSARAALVKGVPVDLHPDQFTDTVAVTMIAHIGAIVWKPAPDRFAIAVFRSFAGSFWHWLSTSAAEFGLKVSREV